MPRRMGEKKRLWLSPTSLASLHNFVPSGEICKMLFMLSTNCSQTDNLTHYVKYLSALIVFAILFNWVSCTWISILHFSQFFNRVYKTAVKPRGPTSSNRISKRTRTGVFFNFKALSYITFDKEILIFYQNICTYW